MEQSETYVLAPHDAVSISTAAGPVASAVGTKAAVPHVTFYDPAGLDFDALAGPYVAGYAAHDHDGLCVEFRVGAARGADCELVVGQFDPAFDRSFEDQVFLAAEVALEDDGFTDVRHAVIPLAALRGGRIGPPHGSLALLEGLGRPAASVLCVVPAKKAHRVLPRRTA